MTELIDAELDFAVAKAINKDVDYNNDGYVWILVDVQRRILGRPWKPSTDWSQGGPLIEEYRINVIRLTDDTTWQASMHGGASWHRGPTPLIAAMRALVASKT